MAVDGEHRRNQRFVNPFGRLQINIFAVTQPCKHLGCFGGLADNQVGTAKQFLGVGVFQKLTLSEELDQTLVVDLLLDVLRDGGHGLPVNGTFEGSTGGVVAILISNQPSILVFKDDLALVLSQGCGESAGLNLGVVVGGSCVQFLDSFHNDFLSCKG